jgi:MFS family permease
MKQNEAQDINTKKTFAINFSNCHFYANARFYGAQHFLPSIAKDLNESPLNMQNAIISYVLTLALFMPVSGFLADKFGQEKCLFFH